MPRPRRPTLFPYNDALPISGAGCSEFTHGDHGDVPRTRPDLALNGSGGGADRRPRNARGGDRKSTRLNSSHVASSYAVFCLKKKYRRVRTLSSEGVGDVHAS